MYSKSFICCIRQRVTKNTDKSKPLQISILKRPHVEQAHNFTVTTDNTPPTDKRMTVIVENLALAKRQRTEAGGEDKYPSFCYYLYQKGGCDNNACKFTHEPTPNIARTTTVRRFFNFGRTVVETRTYQIKEDKRTAPMTPYFDDPLVCKKLLHARNFIV
jgi:hypothetical protein